MDFKERNNASVPLFVAIEYLEPIYFENFFSNSFTYFPKVKSEDFKFPYQDRGSNWNSEELYSIDYSFKDEMPHKFYLPQSAEQIAFKKLIKIIWNKIKRRIKIFTK